jgi:hypothetical protein
VLPAETVTLPVGTYAIGKGLFHPELLLIEGERESALAKFPPRCRTHDEELDRVYRLGGVRAIGVLAVWKWLKEVLGFSRSPAPRPG